MKAVLQSTVLAAAFLLAAPTAQAQTTHVVNLSNFSFSPSTVDIELGDTVRFTWVMGFHNVESGVGGVFDGAFTSGAPGFGQPDFDVLFDAAFLNANPRADNAYPFYCSPHVDFGMTGVVNVDAPLAVSQVDIDLSDGGTQIMTLDAGAANASKLYWVVGSASGISPGFPPLPLNFDSYLLFTIQFPNTLIAGSLSFLNATGGGLAAITLPAGSDPTLAGIQLDHAFAVVEFPGGSISFVSNPLPVRFVP